MAKQNKRLVLDVRRVRDLDRRASEEIGIPSLLLMENAGRSVAEGIENRFFKKGFKSAGVLILCGKGNNGGDGVVIARHLFQRGHPVHVFLAFDPADLKGDAALNYRIIQRIGIPVSRFNENVFYSAARARRTNIFVDALVGTGFKGPVLSPLDRVINAVNKMKKEAGSNAVMIAVDIPSGLDGDEGSVGSPIVKADCTFTLACLKPGLLKPSSKPFVGRLRVVDIGIPRKLSDSYRNEGGRSV